MNDTNVEIERRFILRNLPERVERFNPILISQFYAPSDAGVIRYRRSNTPFELRFEKIIKMSVSKGVNSEMTLPIDKERFEREVTKDMKSISKRRYAFQEGFYKYEFDVFDDMRLIILEIELDSEEQLETDLRLPSWVKDEIIAEITGMKDFSNYNMAR